MGLHRRHVFFVPGFDPKGASHYHGIYQREAARQGQVTGAHYEVGPRTRLPGGNSAWTVRGTLDGQACESVVEHVRWDDLVRASWPRTLWGLLRSAGRGYRAALASGQLRKVWQAAPRTVVALAYPAVFWMAALLAGLLLGAVLAAVLPGPAIAWTLAGLVAGAALALRWERKLETTLLLRIYGFAEGWAAGDVVGIDARVDQLAAAIETRLADPAVDEVLLVGFSVGSLLAASAAARVQARAGGNGASLDRFALVTLGNCIPLLGLMPRASRFRAELAQLRQAPAVRWVDFSSVTDWVSFARVDPVALCVGAATEPGARAPLLASPRFHTMFDPADYSVLVKDKRRMHLQYLMAGRKPAAYDYFAITAGPRRLAERWNDFQVWQ